MIAKYKYYMRISSHHENQLLKQSPTSEESDFVMTAFHLKQTSPYQPGRDKLLLHHAPQ